MQESIEAETRQALDNLEAVLETVGASADEIVRRQIFLADLVDYQAMNEVYSTYFEAPPPARSAVEADSLSGGARAEITATAQK